MANEVKLVLAQRTGINIKNKVFFEKAKTAIDNSLNWLESRTLLFSATEPTYLDFHLISAWDHLKYFDTVELNYPSLESIVMELNQQPKCVQTAPLALATP